MVFHYATSKNSKEFNLECEKFFDEQIKKNGINFIVNDPKILESLKNENHETLIYA